MKNQDGKFWNLSKFIHLFRGFLNYGIILSDLSSFLNKEFCYNLTDPKLCYRLPFPIEQKGMTFEKNFGYSFPLWSSLIKMGKRNGEWIAKIVIKSHAFLLDHLFLDLKNGTQEILKEICLIDVGSYNIYIYSIYIIIYLSIFYINMYISIYILYKYVYIYLYSI